MGSNDTLNYLAGNPILINIFTGVNASGRYRIYSGTGYATLLFEGNVFSVSGIAQVDITELFENLKTSAGITPAKMVTVDALGVEHADGVNSIYIYKFSVYGGGISNVLQRKLIALNTDIFTSKLKASNRNFFLTTRTNGDVISIPEDEIMPLSFYGKGLKFYVKADVGGTVVTVATVDRTADVLDSLQSIDFSLLRSSLVSLYNVLVSVFDIVTDTSYSCSVIFIESEKQTEYFLKFRNSWGSWEKIALQGEISFTPVFSEVIQVAQWDIVVNDFVTKNERKEITNTFPASVGYRSEAERLFIIDMMMSDNVILIAHGLEYMVNVNGELPALVSTSGVVTDVALKIDLVDKETNFSDLMIESEYEVLAIMTLEDITSGNADIIV